MSQLVSLTTRSALLENDIEVAVAQLSRTEPLQLPRLDDPLVGYFVTKIEGNYDTVRAKTDTDHAIELLYIAYNTTPQEQGEIRIQIAAIMNSLIKAQQDSERRIKEATRVAKTIGEKLKSLLPDWLDAKASNDPTQIKAFIGDELIEMAKTITTAASGVMKSLDTIVVTYDQILKDIQAATAKSELALSHTIEANQKIRDEISVANARREQLDGLVRDLQEQVSRYEQLARNYAAQAKNAEQKSFWASLLKSATQVLSAVMPIAAMALSGGTSSLIGAATVGAAALQKQRDVDPQTLVRKAALEAQRQSLGAKVEAQEKSIATLEAQREAASSDTVVKELEERIALTRGECEANQAKLSSVNEQLSAILNQLSAAASAVADDQKAQARSLRELEAQMLLNVEKYENTRREQAAELTKISILLDSKRTHQQTIELAVRSLNVSVTALKRSKEIVEEMAFFFKSFSAFMNVIIEEAMLRLAEYERATSREVGQNRLRQLLITTDEFFITQTGEWLAVGIVSDRFAQSFNEGWTKLNKLAGTYITGERLDDYLVEASAKLKAIVKDREMASNHRIASLHSYREELDKLDARR